MLPESKVWVNLHYLFATMSTNARNRASISKAEVAGYPMPDDYVFASETMRGKQPYWPDNLMKRHIRPVAKANGIHKNIGWHTFRHTFGTLLKANGEDVKTVQELLRHANSRITLDTYTQAVSSTKRAAQSKVVRMMVPGVGQTGVETDPQIVQRGA
jgi:integrase